MTDENTLTPGTRSRNMAKRRAAILSQARAMIADDGFDALKLRDLAQRAKLTVPTIYNLIGGKQEILSEIIEDLVQRLQLVQQPDEQSDIEHSFEARIDQIAALLATDEKYYKAAFIAGDRSGLFEQTSASGIFARSAGLLIDACTEAVAAGLLRGKISSSQMGLQIYGCYRLARQDWMNGYFGLQGFRQQALTGIFTCLAADATPAFKKRLLARLQEMQHVATDGV